MRIAIRVEVSTERGLRLGVPALMRLFSTYQVRATFFFPLGRDASGRRPWRAWRARRPLGLGAVVRGTLIPAADLVNESMRLLNVASGNGHDVGLFGGSPSAWADRLAYAGTTWVEAEWQGVLERFENAGGQLPVAFATPEWQTNPELVGRIAPTRVRYTSMTRGRMPYRPVLQGKRSDVPEIPTTLPTVDEMLRQPGVSMANVHEYLYAESQHVVPAGHVFAASAEREGQDRLELMEKLLVMWKSQEGSVRALADLLAQVDVETLPRHRVGWATPDGAERAMATQSLEVPA